MHKLVSLRIIHWHSGFTYIKFMTSVTNLEKEPTNNLGLYKRNPFMISLSTSFFLHLSVRQSPALYLLQTTHTVPMTKEDKEMGNSHAFLLSNLQLYSDCLLPSFSTLFQNAKGKAVHKYVLTSNPKQISVLSQSIRYC